MLHLVRDLKVGGFHVFGSARFMPQVMLNPVWGGGQRLAQGRALRGRRPPEPPAGPLGHPAFSLATSRAARPTS